MVYSARLHLREPAGGGGAANQAEVTPEVTPGLLMS